MCAFIVLSFVFPCQAKRLAQRTSPKWPILCRVGRKTLTQSINWLCWRSLEKTRRSKVEPVGGLVECYGCRSRSSVCGFADVDGPRYRRAASQCTSSTHPVCSLLVVADYRFYRGMGNSDLQRTTSYLASFSFWFSDHYFRSVCWFVRLFVQSFSQPSLIRFRSNLDICYMSGSSCVS